MNNHQRQSLRIIGGKWKGRKIIFSEQIGLRPTANRIRETLFNWLQGDLSNAKCLDLFSGSGALGIEALSRGAGIVKFIENGESTFRTIESNVLRSIVSKDNQVIATGGGIVTRKDWAKSISLLDSKSKSNPDKGNKTEESKSNPDKNT